MLFNIKIEKKQSLNNTPSILLLWISFKTIYWSKLLWYLYLDNSANKLLKLQSKEISDSYNLNIN